MPWRLTAVAVLLVVATVAACASASHSSTLPDELPGEPLVAVPSATRYKLDAIRVADGATYQGTLEVRGDRAVLLVDAALPARPRAERRFAGTIERGDVTQLALEPAGRLACTDDGDGLSCRPTGEDRIFDGRIAALRFERLSTRLPDL